MSGSSAESLAWPLERAARHFADKTAVVDGDRRATYGELERRVLGLGSGIARLGVGRGERIGYLGVNSLPHLECVLGLPAQGFVLVDLNYRLSLGELAFMVEDTDIGVLIVDRENLEPARRLRETCDSLRTLVLAAGDPAADCLPYEELIDDGPAPDPVVVGPDTLAAISYTGGTTGRPKGVMLSHGNLLSNAKHNLIATGHRSTDVMLHAPPMFHAAGIANAFASTWVGARQVIVPRFEPAAVATAIEADGVTLAILVPTMIAMLLDHLDEHPYDLSSLRNLQYAASPISFDLQRRAAASLPGELAQFYGMTEAAPTVSHLSPEDHERGLAGGEPQLRRLGSAGRPVPGVQVELRGEDGGPSPVGEIGEVCVRGPNVMLGYWGREEETAAAFDGGWYRSGDLGREDEDGYLFLVDRSNDMIITGGENVYPTEVERALTGHPRVREAAVFGVPDARWGESVHAVVVLGSGGGIGTETERLLTEHCRTQVARFKVPRSFELRVDPLPLSGAGKVLKQALRKPHWTGTGQRP